MKTSLEFLITDTGSSRLKNTEGVIKMRRERVCQTQKIENATSNSGAYSQVCKKASSQRNDHLISMNKANEAIKPSFDDWTCSLYLCGLFLVS